jgi:hypothetical protein
VVESEATRAAIASRARWSALACGLAIVALSAVPRLVGLEVGGVLAAAHPDESPVVWAQWQLGTGTPSLALIAYGGGYHGPLHLLLRASSALGVETVLDARPDPSIETQYRYLLPIRAWSAALSIAAVATVFCAGRAAAGTAAGAIAALILAAAPAAIRDAHLAKADAAATFAAALVIAALARSWRRSAPFAIGVGCAAGLAFSTKYAIGLLPAAALAVWWGPRAADRGALRRLLTFAAASIATVVALNAFWLFHPADCWRLLLETLDSQYRYAQFPWLAAWVRSPLEYHTMVSLRWGCGGVAALLAGPALIAGLARGGAVRWAVLAAFGQLAVLMANPTTWSRNLMPVVPGLALAIGVLVTDLASRVSAGYRRAILAIGAALLVAAPGWDGMRMAWTMRQTDTRGLAAAWIAAHVPSDSALIGFGGPPANLWGLPDLGGRRLVRGVAWTYWRNRADFVVRYRYPIAWASKELPREASLGPPLVVFDPFAPGADPVVEPLDAFYLPLARFAGVERPGPRIEIYSLASDPG